MTTQPRRRINLRFVKLCRRQCLAAVARLDRPGLIDRTNDLLSIVQMNCGYIRHAGCTKSASNGGSG
jgi:hypothetical protein